MFNTKKTLVISLAIASIFTANVSFADTNKDTIINNITNSINSINIDRTWSGKIQILKDTVYTISNNFSSTYTSLWYDDKTVSYLVSLGKLQADYKKDLVTEFNALKNEIDAKYSKNISDLNDIKDEINLSYSSLSAEQKAIYQAKIDTINSDFAATDSYADTQTNALKNKYNSYLSTIKANLPSLVSSNKTSLDAIKNFDTNFSSLASKKENLDSNYTKFKTTYLWGISTLTDFIGTTKTKYTNLMKTQLLKMLDLNIDSNPGLADYRSDLSDYIDFLTNKFSLNLEKNVDDNYSIIYSQSKMDDINTAYSEFKAKYIDINGLVKVSSFSSDNSGALSRLSSLTSSVSDLNTKLANLTITWATNIENVKIILENQIIEYYNWEFASNKASLLLKMKDELWNIATVNDLIDTKYQTYSLAVASWATDTYFDTKTQELKTFLNKYADSSNSTIKNKILKISYYLDNSYLSRELENKKYKLYSYNKHKYEDAINTAIKQLDTKLQDEFVAKMEIVLSRVDNALSNTGLSTSNKYKLLIIKQTIRNYIYKNKM